MVKSANAMRTMLVAIALAWTPIAMRAQSASQHGFTSPRLAAKALFEAVKANDQTKMLAIFGPEGQPLVDSGDPQQDAKDRATFVEKYQQAHRLVKEPSGGVVLYIGAANWPFPIPLIDQQGHWTFDTDAGKQQILLRRIGKNELAAIEVCHELVSAEKEHYAGAHPGEAGSYAPYFTAESGQHNGLYHPVQSGQPEIGPLLAEAGASGEGQRTPFHGYYYRILTKQGKKAPGGAKNYIVDGKMSGGFAFVAYPAEYRSTGVMTFLVSQDGAVYEKDLGPKTTSIAASLSEFNPDSSWSPAQ